DLGKKRQVAAADNRLPGNAKVCGKAGEWRQWENIEERRGEPIAKPVGPASCKRPFARRAAHILKRLAAHGGGQVVAESQWESSEDQSNVGSLCDVIAGDQHGPSKFAKMLATSDFGML